MFFDPSTFNFVAQLESHWADIKQELDDLQQQEGKFIPWMEKFLYKQGWEVFGLYAFGHKLHENCQLCPTTAHLVEQIPGMTTAGFSAMKPGTHILPHVGYTNAVLRCHLGLIIPEDCAIRVGEQTRSWQAGKCMIFDDTIEHEAWNRSPTTRFILLIDFERSKHQIEGQSAKQAA